MLSTGLNVEILDLFYTSNHHLVSHISTEAFDNFTDHKIVTVTVNYQLGKEPVKEKNYLLDSACRLGKLDFSKAPWPEIKKELKELNWSTMSHLASKSPTLAHSWFLYQLIPVLERLVPERRVILGGRNRLHRNRKLLWRKLKTIKEKLGKTTSVAKLVKLLQDRQEMELELKLLYSNLNASSEAKVISEMKENPKVFFSYAKARQKVKAKVGPFIDEETGDLNLDPGFTAECLSMQYSSVFSQPRTYS